MANFNTPGVPEPEVSAMQQRAKTAAFPNDQTEGQLCARVYVQAVEAPDVKDFNDNDDDDQAKGQGPAY